MIYGGGEIISDVIVGIIWEFGKMRWRKDIARDLAVCTRCGQKNEAPINILLP
jgi:hypothetical protein